MGQEPVHILLLSSWYPSEKHPFLGNFVERHAQLLSQHYQVTVLVTESDEEEELRILETQHKSVREIRVRHPRKQKLLERRRSMERALTAGLEHVEKADLIIGHVILQKGLQFVQAKKFFNCPLILVEHGSYFRPAMRCKRSWIESLIIRKVRKHLDEVVAVSDFLKKDMQTDFPRHHIQVIGNAVDSVWFAPVPKKRHGITHFLHVSTLDERTKNPEGLLCACRSLKETNTPFRMTIISDEDTTRWSLLASQLGISEQVEFIGPLAWEEVAAYYHAADAFVLFSNYESFSIVLAEAWSTGTPVISTPVGIAAAMPETCGILVVPEDISSLAEAMRRVATSEVPLFDSGVIAAYGSQFHDTAILNKWTELIDRYVG